LRLQPPVSPPIIFGRPRLPSGVYSPLARKGAGFMNRIRWAGAALGLFLAAAETRAQFIVPPFGAGGY